MFTSILHYFRDKLLTRDEKLLRRTGLVDASGRFTPVAWEIAKHKFIKDQLPYLVELATEYEEENKKA